MEDEYNRGFVDGYNAKNNEIIRCRHCRFFSGESDRKGTVTAIGFCTHENHKIMPLPAGFYCADAKLTKKKWRLE